MAHILYGVERQGSINLAYARDGLELSFTEIYRVRADSKTATMWEVMRDTTCTDPNVLSLLGTHNGVGITGLPLPGLAIDRDGICRCRSLNGERLENNPFEWEFTAQWDSKVQDGRGGASQNGDPTVPLEQVIPIRETTYDPITRRRATDIDGNAYTNGAGDPFADGVEFDEELPRWDFAQFDANYEGSVNSFSTTYAGMTGDYSVLSEPDFSRPGQPWVWVPGVYRNVGGSYVLWAPTDATVFYMNGCINMIPWLGFPAFTLILRVRSSRVGYYNGQRRRLTEFTVIYDREKWFSRVVNKGPNFVAPRIDQTTGDILPADFTSYPYIYYTQDVEDGGTDLAIQQDGLLTNDPLFGSQPNNLATLELAYISNQWKTSSDFLNTKNTAKYGYPIAGYKKVQTAEVGGVRTYTMRAIKSDGTIPPQILEYRRNNLLPFGAYLRPTLVGPYIPGP